MSIWLQKSASIQPRTSLHEPSEDGSFEHHSLAHDVTQRRSGRPRLLPFVVGNDLVAAPAQTHGTLQGRCLSKLIVSLSNELRFPSIVILFQSKTDTVEIAPCVLKKSFQNPTQDHRRKYRELSIGLLRWTVPQPRHACSAERLVNLPDF